MSGRHHRVMLLLLLLLLLLLFDGCSFGCFESVVCCTFSMMRLQFLLFAATVDGVGEWPRTFHRGHFEASVAALHVVCAALILCLLCVRRCGRSGCRGCGLHCISSTFECFF
jgi:hypothetical protein